MSAMLQLTPPASASSSGAAVRPSLITPIDGPPASKRSCTRERSQGPVEMSVRQIEDARQASLGKVLDVWSRLEERYAVPLEDDDVVDISTGRIVEDRGVLRSMLANGPRLFGFAPHDDEAEPVTEAETDCEAEEEESDDELGRWPSDNANHMDNLRRRMQLDPLDKEDLESFLRAEQERRRLEDEPEQGSSRATSPDIDAPLPEVYESDDGDPELPPATSDAEEELNEASESEDELLLVDDDDEPSATRTVASTPKPKPKPKPQLSPVSKIALPTPPRSQSMDSTRAQFPSPVKQPPSTPRRAPRTPTRVASTPSSRSNARASTSKPVFARPEPPAPKRVMEVVLPLYTKPSSPQHKNSPSGRKHTAQVLPTPSPSMSDVPHVDFSRRRKTCTPSPRKTPAATTPSPASTQRKATQSASRARQSTSGPSTPRSSNKGKSRAPPPLVVDSPSPASSTEPDDPMALVSRTPSPVAEVHAVRHSPSPPPAASSPRKRKRISNTDGDAHQASPTKRRAQSHARERPKVEHSPPSSPTRPVAGPSSAPGMAWPGWQMPMPQPTPPFAMPAMPMHPQQVGGQHAFVAQFMAQVQHMNMLAHAMLPSFFPSVPAVQQPLPPTPPARARSADSRSPEPEHRPRRRSSLRKSTSSAEPGVRKRVSFLLQNDDRTSDEDERGRGRERVRIRGTPAPGRGEGRSRTSSAPAR